jgi:hypothetical protein
LIIYKFIRIFCSRSFAQLNATFDIYGEQNNKNDIEKAIKKEMSRKLERAFLAIVKSIRNKPGYFAELLHEAMKGISLAFVVVCHRTVFVPFFACYQNHYVK